MLLKLILPTALLIVLSGCASLGASDYSCKGRPGKPLCRSTTEVYARTHKSDQLVKLDRQKGEALEGEEMESSAPAPIPNPVSSPAPQIPVEDPLPIRTPARVMRIWIAPWEDEEGDLIASGYVYTEIEPRRWQVGIQNSSESQRVVEPLRQALPVGGVPAEAADNSANTHGGKPR
jgi:conjugal transfer pilus assembly protein TraV